MTRNGPQTQVPLSKGQRLNASLFRWIPTAVLAEPFEIFLVILATIDVVTLSFHEIQHSDQLFINYFYGPAGLWAWASFMMLGNILMVAALARMNIQNAFNIRRMEVAGLLIYSAAFGFYAYMNLARGLNTPGIPDVYPILSEVVLVSAVLACLLRALSLISPITALAVSRAQRIKMIKAELKRASQNGDNSDGR